MNMISAVTKAPSAFWDKVIATVFAGLILAGVVALFGMWNSVGKLEERVSNWTQVFEKRIDGFETKYDRKIERIEDEIRVAPHGKP